MAGTITHEWNGTILTITSDSGTSSMDLKGGQGDIGPRGPQGPAGIVTDGSVDLSGYATEAYVDEAIEAAQLGGSNVDLTDYYTKSEVDAKIDAIEPESTDLSDYYTKSEVDAKIPSLTGYATEDFVTGKIAEAQLSSGDGTTVDLSGYALKSDIPDLTPYALKTEIPDVSNFTTMTAVEAKGYQTAAEVQTAIDNALAALNGDEVSY